MLIITDCLFFSSSRSLLNISCIFLICASTLFLRSWIIFTIITLNSFSGRLSISSLFRLVGFYLAPSSATYFSVASFCLTYCVYGLFSTGCRVIVALASVVCPLVGEVGPGACVGFLVGGTGAYTLVDRAESLPPMGRASSGDVFWGVCDLSTTLGSLCSLVGLCSCLAAFWA